MGKLTHVLFESYQYIIYAYMNMIMNMLIYYCKAISAGFEVDEIDKKRTIQMKDIYFLALCSY